MADKPCGSCRKFDPIIGQRLHRIGYGRCVPRSTYPAREGPGQVFPPGARRASEGAPADAHVVPHDHVATYCTFYEAR